MSLVNLDVLNITGISARMETSGEYAWVRLMIESADGGRVNVVLHPTVEFKPEGLKADKDGIELLKNFFSLQEPEVVRAA